MKKNSSDVRFSDLSKVCIYYFGQARQKDGSHHVYKTPWKGDPQINIQNYKGQAKAYQVNATTSWNLFFENRIVTPILMNTKTHLGGVHEG